MQFEDFDKKIKDAADHHHPAYDEKAWSKMEKLLNKHLPQKEDDRRRFLFIILLFLGLGGGTLLITKPWKKSNKEVIAANQTVKQDQPSKPVPAVDTKEPVPATNEPAEVLVPVKDNYLMPDPANKKNSGTPAIITGVPVNADPPAITVNGKPVSMSPAVRTKSGPVTVVKKNADPNSIQSKQDKITANTDKDQADPVSKKNKDDQPVETGIVNEPAAKTKEPARTVEPIAKNDVKGTATNEPVAKTDVKKDDTLVAKNNEKKNKEKKKKQSSFFFSFSAGSDLSFVRNNKAGAVKLLTGAGVGYNFKDRLTVRTGFYTGRKVYTATADAYDPPAAFFSLYPYLEKVDANCKVYEIPLSLSYNFGKGTSKNWFVSAGLSTFLMNEETYNYHYKYTPQGNTYTNKWTLKNENTHFFSVATISGGYKKDIGKKITVMAEPYFKIPMGGVGYGKVKLNSGGVLFTVGIKPF